MHCSYTEHGMVFSSKVINLSFYDVVESFLSSLNEFQNYIYKTIFYLGKKEGLHSSALFIFYYNILSFFFLYMKIVSLPKVNQNDLYCFQLPCSVSNKGSQISHSYMINVITQGKEKKKKRSNLSY